MPFDTKTRSSFEIMFKLPPSGNATVPNTVEGAVKLTSLSKAILSPSRGESSTLSLMSTADVSANASTALAKSDLTSTACGETCDVTVDRPLQLVQDDSIRIDEIVAKIATREIRNPSIGRRE